jgi:hypothetical protein
METTINGIKEKTTSKIAKYFHLSLLKGAFSTTLNGGLRIINPERKMWENLRGTSLKVKVVLLLNKLSTTP